MLALLEASRREESGDTAGAWDCHRAVLRTITHLRRRGSTLQRQNAREASRMLQRRLTDWATGPRTTISQLRTALEVVLENEPKPEWDLFAVKYGYLELMGALEQPIPLSAQQAIEGEWTFRLGDMSLSPDMVGQLEAARRFLLREPERSRRVLRLLCANYLAHVETRGRQPRKPAVLAVFTYLTSTNPITKGKIHIPLYPVGPEAPAGARALPPQGVAGWLVATLDARLRLIRGYDEWLPPVRPRDWRTVADRRAYRDLVIMLATEIYRRERRGTTADRGRPGRDLSPEPARRRIGRVSRWDDADSRVADSDVSAHPSRDVARGRRRPLSDLEAGSGASHRRVRPSPQKAHY